jgi:hypothetical protein
MSPGRVRLNRFDRFFGDLPDRRSDRKQCHPLSNLLAMALCGSISGADDCEALEVFAALRASFFATFLDLSDFTPSADAFRRVLAALEPGTFATAFHDWSEAFARDLGGATVAPDGASLRVAASPPYCGGPFAGTTVAMTRHQLILRRPPHDDVSTMLDLLEMLDLRGATVTIALARGGDGLARTCRIGGADCILALDGHRGTLAQQVKEIFTHLKGSTGVRTLATAEDVYGRIERRVVRTLRLRDTTLARKTPVDFETAIEIVRTRTVDDRPHLERSYYLTNLPPDPPLLLRRLQSAGPSPGLEIALDEAHPPDPFGAQNLACIARAARSLLARAPNDTPSLAARRRRAAWNHDYLLRVLTAANGVAGANRANGANGANGER